VPSQRGDVRTTATVVIADDDPTVLRMVQRVVESVPGWRVVAAVGDAPSAVEAVDLHEPDVVVLDVIMPGGGANACRAITSRDAAPVVIALSAYDDEIARSSMFGAGATDYVVKGRPVDELIRVIERHT
jgi:CheY-like chemotaxis protein